MYLLKNKWAGLGVIFILWVYLTSTAGQKIPPEFSVFGYIYDSMKLTTREWVKGKIVALAVTIVILFVIKYLLKTSRNNVV